jgi:adenylate cyclase
MPSILPTFEYDIFISYRHNDNRSGWVTDFVNSLQEELAATIKEPLSIYFDKNPHDGLLETHSVDKSLEGKLKCLIFIPIISQTYCDPKSFAWQHEFVAFNKLSKEDQFGRDIKLHNGNVASRIFPIKIHDLDIEDKSIIENEIEGALRTSEFIYKEPGVNRPLKSSDNKNENLNRSDYRNQMNKVANAIKEIITALKKPSSSVISVKQEFKNTGSSDVLDSIAVLPFANMSSDPEQEYFSDGISEEIINVLAKLPNLKVAGRTSAFSFKGKHEDLRIIGEKLGVKTVLEGSVRKAGTRMRITAQLIDVNNGFHLWSEKYDREMKDIFEIQDEIAKAIVEELKLHLIIDNVQLAKSKRQNLEAYNCYLKGRFFWNNNRSKEGLERTIKYFEQAIELDPNYALAYLGIAESYAVMADWGYIPVQNVAIKIREYGSKAYELDSTLSNVHFTKLYIALLEWNWSNAKIEGEKALEHDPKSARVHHMYGFSKMFFGNFKEALEYNNRARELEPLAVIFNFARGLILYMSRQVDEAIVQFHRALELDDRFAPANFFITHCYLLKGMHLEAVEEFKKLLVKNPTTENHALIIDNIFLQSGIEGFLYWLINTGIDLQIGTYNQAYHKAVCYALLKDKDKSFECIAMAIDQRSFRVALIKYDPGFDNLRDDPRFDIYVKKVGL